MNRIDKAFERLDENIRETLPDFGQEVQIRNRVITGRDEYKDPTRDTTTYTTYAEVIRSGEAFERHAAGIDSELSAVFYVDEDDEVYIGDEETDRSPSRVVVDYEATEPEQVFEVFQIEPTNTAYKILHCRGV